MRAASRKELLKGSILNWWFELEISHRQKFGFRIAEVPVRWEHTQGTRTNALADGIRMFQEMLHSDGATSPASMRDTDVRRCLCQRCRSDEL